MELQSICYEEKETLRHLMELYQYETSPYEREGEGDVQPNGLFGYKYLDHYWTEEGRHAFFIRVSGKLAGFALLRELEPLEDGGARFSMAEFFVMLKYRRTGIGRQAAGELFRRFKGTWSVSWLETNVRAQRFWETTIAEHTGGKLERTVSAYNGNPAVQFES